jgi:hypothetical protein
VLAALSAAVVGSYLGVAGTLAGAAGRQRDRIGRHRGLCPVDPQGQEEIPGDVHGVAGRDRDASGGGRAATTIASAGDGRLDPAKVRWKRVALVAGALFVLAIGTLTAAELIRRPLDRGRDSRRPRRPFDRLVASSATRAERPKNQINRPASTPSESPTHRTTTTEPPTGQPHRRADRRLDHPRRRRAARATPAARRRHGRRPRTVAHAAATGASGEPDRCERDGGGRA